MGLMPEGLRLQVWSVQARPRLARASLSERMAVKVYGVAVPAGGGAGGAADAVEAGAAKMPA